MLDTGQNMSGDDAHLPTLAARLRWARERKGLTGVGLARAIKREGKTIYRYEARDPEKAEMPSRSTLKQLARVLGVSAVWLEYGRGQPYGLQEVEDYLLTPEASEVASAVADALREMPWVKMGMAKPSLIQVNEVRIVLELLMRGTRQRSNGDEGG